MSEAQGLTTNPRVGANDDLGFAGATTAGALARAHVERIAFRKLKAFLGTIDADGVYYDPVHKQNQSLSQHIIADYHGRFLIELIQNAHDAHGRHVEDGRIAVLLASDEGESGTLYVANDGSPFEAKNVDAICEMGLSSKPPGEAVGNKGLGFRSVRHVTDDPQIFSRVAEGGAGHHFDGYCFKFGRGSELDPLLPNETTRALARADLPAFYIPLWIEQVPAAVAEFGNRGFSTVIRLPLRNSSALEVVRAEMLTLSMADAPILLFLRRLQLLEAKLDGERLAKDQFNLGLTRSEKPLGPASGPTMVDLGANGRFWVARVEVPESEMQAAVAEGLDSGALPESWRGWKGAGEAAVAVPIGGEREGFNPRLYTFLPMGRGATSPFRGHLHGSFFPSSNRMSLDPTIRVNSLVLDHALALASSTAKWLECNATEASGGEMPSTVVAKVAIDLLMWRTPSSLLEGDGDDGARAAVDLGRIMSAEIARRWGVSAMADAEFVPCLGDWRGDPLLRPEFGPIRWDRPSRARRSIVDTGAFSNEAIARHGGEVGVALLWPGLGESRTARLLEFLRLHTGGAFRERISPSERAEVVEALAITMECAVRPDWGRWSSFYRELPDFMGADVSALAGRRILFCQDGTLRATPTPTSDEGSTAPVDGAKPRRRRGAREASIFVPPRRGETEEIGEEFYPPAPVREYFAFLHEELHWYGDLSAARQFLEKGLATQFESEALLVRISQILDVDTTRKVRTATLRWAFAIWRRSVAIKRPIALSSTYRLFVPTMTGEFIRVSDAIFSPPWPDRTLGHQLQQFLELAPEGVKDIEDVRGRRLAPPSNPAFGMRQVEEWTDFLMGLGVQRGLEPVSAAYTHYVSASRVLNFEFLENLDLPVSMGALLKQDIANRPNVSLWLPTGTDYDVGTLWWMPGQADIGRFSDEALDAYGVLVVAWIGRAEHRHLWTIVKHRHNYRSDHREWPTPLAAFLRSAPWILCDETSDDGLRRRRSVGRDVWLPRAGDRYPPFLRRPSYKMLRAFDRASDATMATLRKCVEFRTFNAPDSLLEQTGFLAEQFERGCVRTFFERELMNIYGRCWSMLADRSGAAEPAAGARPDRLLVRRRGRLGCAQVAGKDAEIVFVRDTGDPIATSLVEVTGEPLMDVRTTDPARVGILLRRLYGDKVRLTSELEYEIRVDSIPLEELPDGPNIVDLCPWLRPMLAVALEALDSVDLNRLPSDRSAIVQTLDRIEFQRRAAVRFVLEEHDVTPPDGRSAYHFERGNGRPLVVMLGGGELSWTRLEAALPAIGEAIQHPAVVPHMKLLARQLAQDGVPIDDKPVGQADLARLCRALELGERASEAARDSLGERLDRQLPWYRAVAFYVGGDPAYETWLQGEAGAIEDRANLIELLRATLPADGPVPDDVAAVVNSSLSVAELRDRLELDFARFNAALVATGGRPDVDEAGQKAQLEAFVDDCGLAIEDALRNMVAPVVLGFEPAPRYQSARRAISTLRPDPAWLPMYQRIPESVLAAHVESWLVGEGAPPMGENGLGLADLMQVRTANATTLRRFVKVAQPLVRAWGIQHSVAVGDLWREVGHAEAELRCRLEESGAFDCRAWSDGDLMRWCARLGAWPSGMMQSLDRIELGVPETEIEAQAQRARLERERLQKEARSVNLNGQARDPEAVDWLKISEEISGGLPRGVLSRPIGTFADLLPAEQLSKRGGVGGGGGSGGGRGGAFVGVPQAKKDMIGLLGELTVYHWLRARQPGQDIDRCWVSGNAEQFTGRPGKDGLGYDFRITFNKQIWYIEVKASTDDPCQFELGETEVQRARDVARSRAAERYVIAYVANVGSTKATTIDILPNPLGPDADGMLNIAGDSIRYNFGRRR